MEFLRAIFEAELHIELDEEGNAVIGETVFPPVSILRSDPTAYDAEFQIWLNDDWLPRQTEKLEALLELHGNGKRFVDLCAGVSRAYVVPLIGSGMSRPSGVPLWTEFLYKIRQFSTTSPEDLDTLLAASAFEEAVEKLAMTMPGRLFDERVEHDLRIDDPSAIRGPVYLLPALFPNLVLTTNLDNVMEHVYA
ncbi:MAG: hypothetical protein ACRDGM_03080, partial [bacterium]